MSHAKIPDPKEPTRGVPDRLVADSASVKIRPHNLERLAVIYVRQSTPRQVIDHQESRARQYLLVDYAVRLGWPRERILTIDEDQGNSGTTTDERLGFQRLLAEVTMDHVGLILGLEMSRLARSDKDWHHLLELCAIFDTLLADQDGVYDATDPNDRMLLGLKGAMSTLELHTMRNRLEKGRLFKAQRGELFQDLPIGYVKTPSGGLALDPDEQVQAVVHLIFDKFAELGSGRAVLRYLVQAGIRLGIRPHDGPNRGQVEWRPPCPSTVYSILEHPFYAGAYAYGRHPVDPKRKLSGHADGRRRVPMEEWKVLKRNCLPAYITWEQYLRNQERLHRNCSGWETPGTPRQGEALLGGLLICGRCGTRMSVYYSSPKHGRYACRRLHWQGREGTCQGLAAPALDALVTQQVLDALEPAALELSLQAGADIQRERDRQARHWQQQLERARYEVRQAERCYRAVDPENRLVARTLEQQWERALQQQQQLEEEHDRFLQHTPRVLSPAERERIQALASDIPTLLNAPATTAADRKAIVRCMIDRVIASVHGDTEYVDVTIHWAGEFASQHQILRPVREYGQLRDFDLLVKRIRELQEDGRSNAEMASQLNQEGFRPPRNAHAYSKELIHQLVSRLGIPGESPQTIVLGRDEWWESSLARRMRMPQRTIHNWVLKGWVRYRRSPLRGYYILWADAKELERLKRLRAQTNVQHKGPYPTQLTTPRKRTAAETTTRA
jgi:DNA invertase Pin-like site-specific DNA recombinase